ncbi:hypothetical protein [Natrarchaeobius oligotrophus]|uniref:DUF8159 domain-containing protein n=1 Tax=Natrarchaeobius chitinivorans TaxID=1679083 RepID=A0A3N6PG31_NATCH|nr:hypothetical protein [Natrarchaeobius chitinivorans]RQG99149.1 hypothetical protein EA472_14845 [Natrarchaeobius chitinivorans]
MPERSEYSTDDRRARVPTTRSRAPSEPEGTNRTFATSRRRALAAVGGVSLGLTAGCLDSVQSIGGSRTAIEPEDPGDERNATPSEFYFFLEENGITVDELYHDTEDDDLILFYESDAETRDESEDEIALIYVVFRDALVARGADVQYLYTEVLDRFEGQVEGWAVNSEWAQQEVDGEISTLDVWNAILRTKVYEEGENPYLPNSSDETDDSAAETGADDDPMNGDQSTDDE